MGLTGSTSIRPSFYFIGDSLTERGSYPQENGFVALLQSEYVRSVDVINRGLSGYNTRWVDRHVLPTLEYELMFQFEPSLVALWLGTNDASLLDGPDKDKHVPLDEYRARLTAIVKTLTPHLPPRAKFLLITPPTVIDSARPDGDRSNAMTREYARVCVEVARTESVAWLDMYAHFNTAYPTERERQSYFADGLHFSALGNAVVAQLLDAKINEIFDASELARFQRMQFPGSDAWVDAVSSEQ